MAEEVSPQKVQLVVKQGFQRLNQYRRARTMFIKEYIGQYYAKKFGLSGDEPINLIFIALRTLVANYVMQNGINEVITNYKDHKMYGELLGLALNSLHKQIKLKDVLRAWIVSAIFALGVVKTGIRAGDQLFKFNDITVDPGQIYTGLVDFDNFVFDPTCKTIEESAFMGDRIQVPRQMLLDSDNYNHDLVQRLPRTRIGLKEGSARKISQRLTTNLDMDSIQDMVDIVELWVPGADTLVTIPDPEQIMFDKYIGITDYYGPKEGPYTLLSFSPPVPGNPLPIATVSLWYDLHIMANRIFKKTMDQAERQKDILVYNPAQADEAQDILEARDGDSVASIDPKGIQIASFGGQNQRNIEMLSQLQIWFNYISGNPDQLSGNMTPGTKGRSATATQSQILQSNASINVEDSRGILYDKTADVSKKQAWYFDTDPLINMPLTKRTTGGETIQLFLTPEQRQGDFLEFTFKIVAKSMSRLDPTIKSKRFMEFASNVVPAAATTAQICMQVGVPFNIQSYLSTIADQMEIGEYVQEWFNDPSFQQRLKLMQSMGPQNAGKASISSPAGISQNGGYPMARNILSPGQQTNQNMQMGAAESQSANQGVY